MQFASFYPLVYRVLRPTFPSCLWSGSQQVRSIALTFDDGPHPDHTPELLRVLARYQIKASFFWLGASVDRYPTLAKEVTNQGHWIGLHGYDHQSFPFLSVDALQQSLWKTQIAIEKACQINPDNLRDVRPPNGLFTPSILQRLQSWQYRVVMWSVVPEDWVNPGVTLVKQRILKQLHQGALIVLHDGYYGGQQVAKITNDLIPSLLDLDYRFLTIPHMWQQKLTQL